MKSKCTEFYLSVNRPPWDSPTSPAFTRKGLGAISARQRRLSSRLTSWFLPVGGDSILPTSGSAKAQEGEGQLAFGELRKISSFCN